MSGGQPETKNGRKGIAVAALLLTASALALLRPAPAFSQETELRGEVSESAILADQQRKARQLRAQGSVYQTPPATAAAQDSAPTIYQPASPGAVPDDDQTAGATDSIFDQPQAKDDPLAATKKPAKPRRPSTASQRAQDAKAGTKSNTKTADKKKAKKKSGDATDGTTTATIAATGNQTDAAATDDDGSNRRAVTIDSVDKQKLDPGQERTASIEGRRSSRRTIPLPRRASRSAPLSSGRRSSRASRRPPTPIPAAPANRRFCPRRRCASPRPPIGARIQP
jgi:hypothetical protein